MKWINHKDQFPLRHVDIFRAKFCEPVIARHYILFIRRAVVPWNKCCVCVRVYSQDYMQVLYSKQPKGRKRIALLLDQLF